MKNFFVLLLFAAHAMQAQVDPKEDSAERSAVIEGKLRATKPDATSTLADGTEIAYWTLAKKNADGKSENVLARATANLSQKTPNEGLRTVKTNFEYESGKLSKVSFAETTIIQNPAPSVSNRAKEFIFTDGVQTSPAAGSAPDIEAFVSEKASEIQKLYESHVHQK